MKYKLNFHFGFLVLLIGAMIANFIMTHKKNAFRASEAMSLNLHDLYCASHLDKLKQDSCMVSVEGNPSESYILNTEPCSATFKQYSECQANFSPQI